jgi:hypothetical protein
MHHIPCWRGLNHFEAIVKVTFTDGSKFEDIEKVLTILNMLPITCVRAYHVFSSYHLFSIISSYVPMHAWAQRGR